MAASEVLIKGYREASDGSRGLWRCLWVFLVLEKKGINAPTSESFLNDILLGIIYRGIMLYRRKPLKAKWYYYVILGLVDVEANFLVEGHHVPALEVIEDEDEENKKCHLSVAFIGHVVKKMLESQLMADKYFF